jgi:hypothetical protein
MIKTKKKLKPVEREEEAAAVVVAVPQARKQKKNFQKIINYIT